MLNEIRMPALPNREAGRISRWFVAEGQKITTGDVLAEIETATATLEIEASGEGFIERILVPAGSGVVAELTPLAIVTPLSTTPSTRNARPNTISSFMSMPDAAPAGEQEEGLGRERQESDKASASSQAEPPASGRPAPRAMSYREALRDALAEEMRRDASVYVIGFDVAQNRGAPEVTQGLADEFGDKRVVATPPLESSYFGLAVGSAYRGLSPVVALPSWGRARSLLIPLLNAAAEAHAASGGAIALPITVRGPNGLAPGSGALDGQCLAAWLAHIPALKVVAPATPSAAKGLLKAAIRDPHPVAVLECEMLYETEADVETDPEWLLPIGQARIARAGSDATIVTYGGALATVMEASRLLEARGVSAEVIDLMTLKPLDMASVISSLRKTGRLVTVEQGWAQGSIGSEVVSRAVQDAFDALTAAPVRLAGADCPAPHTAALTALALPQADDVAAAVEGICARR